jgi:hypothetical protein
MLVEIVASGVLACCSSWLPLLSVFLWIIGLLVFCIPHLPRESFSDHTPSTTWVDLFHFTESAQILLTRWICLIPFLQLHHLSLIMLQLLHLFPILLPMGQLSQLLRMLAGQDQITIWWSMWMTIILSERMYWCRTQHG